MRRRGRCLNRRCLRGRRHGPGDLSQALTALGRALRAHRRLARLAPSFFDSAVVDREAENRAERRRWMATWEPFIARAYGGEPHPPKADNELPLLPSPRIQREVERKLAEREMCLVAGRIAMERYKQRQPHALMSWSRMARLLDIGFEFRKLACGLEIINPVPEKITYDYDLTDFKRGYGHKLEAPAKHAVVPVPVTPASPSSAAIVPDLPVPSSLPLAAAPSPPAPPRCDASSRWARQLRRMKS